MSEYGDGVAWIRGAMIGKGDFGRVYHVTFKNNPASQYMSCFPPVMAVKSAEFSFSSSIQKEMEVMKNLKGCSNYIIGCFGEELTTGTNEETTYNLLLEYASGGSLGDLIKKRGRRGLPKMEAKMYARSILRGLKHIHGLGFVHCDLKPDNILLVNDHELIGKGGFMRAKIADFGLTKKLDASPTGRKWKGTKGYLSPEAVTAFVQETPSDIWALGCIMVEMLTGKTIFVKGEDKLDTLADIGVGLEKVRIPKEVSDEARAFLARCFVTKPELKWTAEELLSHDFLQGLPDDEDIDIARSTPLVSNNEHTCASSMGDNGGEWQIVQPRRRRRR